jgi:ABC-type sugar transport system permease subunit
MEVGMSGKHRLPHRVISGLLIALLLTVWLPVLAQDDSWEKDLGDVIYSTALSSDGNVQIVGSRNNRAAAYDQGGNLLWEFAPKGTVWGVATSADGQWTAVGSEDRNIYLLDKAGKSVWTYRSSRIVLGTAISPDNTRVAAVDEGRSVYFINRETGEVVWTAKLEDIADTVAMYSADAVLVGTRASQVIRLDADGKPAWRTQLKDDITSIAATSDGTKVAAGSLDGSLTLLNGADGKTLWQIPMPSAVRCNARERRNCLSVGFSGDGQRILVGTRNGDVYLLNGADGNMVQASKVDTPVSAVAFSTDGKTWLLGTRGGKLRSATTAGEATAFAASQTEQRNLLIGIPLVMLAVGGAAAVWINRTQAGRQFWNVTSRPVRRTLWLMWRSRTSYLLIAPTILLLLIFNYYPASSGLYHSFTVWNPGVETRWVGLDQFGKMLQSDYFWIGMKNAVLLAVAAFVKLGVPLMVAEMIFNIRRGFWQYSIRTLFVVPLVVPSVVGILLWVNIYDPNIGLLNQTLQSLGLADLTRSWLGDRNTALGALIAIGFPWISPFALLIFYGGLISIPQELFDAAKVDGATWRQRFFNVDIPLIMSQIKLLLILAFIGSVQEFQLIFLTTGGGPGNVTYTPALEMYYNATRFTNFGLASAMGTFLFLIILGGTIINLRYVRSQTEYEA